MAGFGLLQAAALIASPGPRRGRHLVNWGHGVVLLLLAAATQISTLMYDAGRPPAAWGLSGSTWEYAAISGVLTAVALVVAAIAGLGWRFLVLLAAMLYPYALELAKTGTGGHGLIENPTPAHLTLLFLPPLVPALCAVISAVLPRRRPAAPDGGAALA